MAEILVRLSRQLDAAVPQLMVFAVVRKVAMCVFGALAFVASCSRLWDNKRVLSVRRLYAYIEMRMHQAWVVCCAALILYVVMDLAFNFDDFLNCRQSTVPRPIGIYCAVSLLCFVFTTRVSVSTMSIVVTLCAKDMNTITGLACVLNFCVWADIKGSSVAFAMCSLLSALKFAFCGYSSNAALCVASACWVLVWGWTALVSSAFRVKMR